MRSGAAAATTIATQNPDMAPWAILIGAGITGILGGLGNWGRTTGGFAKALFGWIG